MSVQNRLGNNYTLPCIALCSLIFLIIGLLPIVPKSVTQVLRPLFVVICFFYRRPQHYPITTASKALLLLLMYLGFVWLLNTITKNTSRDYFSMITFGLFFVIATQRVWTEAEIRLIMYSIIIASTFCALILLINNPNLRSMNVEYSLSFFDSSKNRNTMAFSLVPGTLCSLLVLLNNYEIRKSIFRLILHGCAFLVCGFTVIATGARSASVALITGVFFVLWHKAYYNSEMDIRIARKVIVGIVAAIVLIVLINITTGTNSFRIFSGFENNSGRDPLWEFAYELIKKKPVFGGGFDYWRNMNGDSLGTHNTYLTIMVVSGYVGAFFLTLFFLSILWDVFSVKNYICMAFFMEVICHTYSESGLDYYAYFPLIFVYIVFCYEKYQKRSISSIFK